MGGQRLSSTGSTEASGQPMKVYPPGAALPSLMDVSGGEKEAEKGPTDNTTDGTPVSGEGGGASEEADPDPVGEPRLNGGGGGSMGGMEASSL